MAKNKDKIFSQEVYTDEPVIRYEADPETFKTIVLKVHKQAPPKDPYVSVYPRSEGENDAILMSQDFPEEAFITVAQNGVPCTISVSELVKDVILQVLMKAED